MYIVIFYMYNKSKKKIVDYKVFLVALFKSQFSITVFLLKQIWSECRWFKEDISGIYLYIF